MSLRVNRGLCAELGCISVGPPACRAGVSRGLSESIRRRVRGLGRDQAGRAWRVSGRHGSSRCPLGRCSRPRSRCWTCPPRSGPKTPCSRLVRACCIWAAQRLPGGSARWVVNWRMRRLVAAGARTASPAAMVRIPATRLAYPEVRAVLAAAGRNQDLDSAGLVTAEQAWRSTGQRSPPGGTDPAGRAAGRPARRTVRTARG